MPLREQKSPAPRATLRVREHPVILVVEDNPITLKMVALALRIEGYEVHEAIDAQTALRYAAESLPDLILQDLLLPDANGVDLVGQLRALPGGHQIPIICFSGFVSKVEEARVAGAGFTDFLVKPVEPSQMLRVIRSYLPTQPSGTPQAGEGRRVLIVDDDPVQLKLVQLVFAQHGFSVTTSQSGAEALAKAEREPPDLIVSDILMPGIDGFRLCAAVRQSKVLRAIPVLLATSNYVDPRDEQFALRIGASAYVTRAENPDSIAEEAIRVLHANVAPAGELPDETSLEAERHERIVSQLERQAALHAACVQRTTVQSAILHELSIIAETLAKRGNFEAALSDILAYCLDGAGLSKGALYILQNDIPVLQAQYGLDQQIVQAQTMFGERYIGLRVARSGEAIALPSDAVARADGERLLKSVGAESALLVPIQCPDGAGVFVLFSEHRDLTQPDWLAFGRSLASQIGQTIVLSHTFYQLAESERRYRSLFEGASDSILLTDEQARVIDANPAANRLTGYRREEVEGRHLDSLVPVYFRARLGAMLTEYQLTGQLKGQFPLQTRSGEERTVQITGSRIGPGLYVNVCHDITDERRAAELIERLAYTDTLTDLANRTALHARLTAGVQAALARNEALGLLLMDLNSFREINDNLGHQNGDMLLIQVAGRLKTTLWNSDMVARLGGDEFAALLPRLAAPEHIEIVMRKIEKAFEAPFMLDDLPIEVQATVGVALCPLHGTDADSLLRYADMAMYKAKALRQHHAVYDPATDHANAAKLALVAQLREAIQNDRLILYYQPKIAVATSAVVGLEALVRWVHPVRGMIYPDEFIPVAERTGLVTAMTLWVLASALDQLATWRSAGYSFSVSVNLSTRDLQDETIVQHVRELLVISGVPAAALMLEVTESAVMVEPERSRQVLNQLRSLGVRTSIDDFGIAYSSLAYLKDLPADQIKVDKSFVMNFADLRNIAIVRAIVTLARDLGREVTAEGVEDAAALRTLNEMHCDTAQGYHIARPMPADAVPAWIDAWQRSHAAPPQPSAPPKRKSPRRKKIE